MFVPKFLPVPILVIQTPLLTVWQEYIYFNWKCIGDLKTPDWKFFEIKSEIFLFMHKSKFNPKVIYKLCLIKLSADLSDKTFFSIICEKSKCFPNFSAGNSFLFFTKFWRFFDRWRITVTVSLLEKRQYNFLIFVIPPTNKCFW